MSPHVHKRFPEKFASLLNNRIRRFLTPPDRLISKLGVKSSDVIMDFGCGPGFYTIPLAKITRRTIGVDVSSRMLEKLASNAMKYHVKIDLARSDGTAIGLEDGVVDIILLVHVFHEINAKSRVLQEFSRILGASGRLVIVERRKGGVFSRKFGAPIINEERVVSEIRREGFAHLQTAPLGDDAILIFQKFRDSYASHA